MSKVVANLDAAIEAYKSEQGQVDRVLRLFERDWNLLSDISTATLNPILQIQAMAEEAKDEEQQNAVGVRALTAIQETIVGCVVESERNELRSALTKIGFPMGALEIVMESIMEVFTAAPLPTQEPTKTPEPLLESTIDSGKSSTQNGATSNPVSTPQPPMPPTATNGLAPREPMPELPVTTNKRWVGVE